MKISFRFLKPYQLPYFKNYSFILQYSRKIFLFSQNYHNFIFQRERIKLITLFYLGVFAPILTIQGVNPQIHLFFFFLHVIKVEVYETRPTKLKYNKNTGSKLPFSSLVAHNNCHKTCSRKRLTIYIHRGLLLQWTRPVFFVVVKISIIN